MWANSWIIIKSCKSWINRWFWSLVTLIRIIITRIIREISWWRGGISNKLIVRAIRKYKAYYWMEILGSL